MKRTSPLAAPCFLVALAISVAPAAFGASQRKQPSHEQTRKETAVLRAGDRISLDLKDADLKDVLRSFAELTKLNIAIDPDVRGSVTVRLQDVPWDQALDLILRMNGLGYVLEGRILRVGRTERLLSDAGDRRE